MREMLTENLYAVCVTTKPAGKATGTSTVKSTWVGSMWHTVGRKKLDVGYRN